MRAFIFSLDAFVAFTLALMAIYSLIFFSSVPASYYFLLTQGHYLARDTLLSLSTTPCVGAPYCTESSTMLESIAFNPRLAMQKELISQNIDKPLLIPEQFGFKVEVANQGAEGGWTSIYDRAVDSPDDNVRSQFAGRNKRISVSSQVLAFGYTGASDRTVCSTYRYRTCRGGCGGSGSETSPPPSGSDGSSSGSGTPGETILITCGNSLNNPPGTSSSSSSDDGGTGSPDLSSGSSGSYIGTVSSPTQARLVRITVYI